MDQLNSARIAVVIPAFRVTRHVLDVIKSIPRVVSRIYVVDDACPDGSGDHVEQHCRDPRVQVLRHQQNQGVGGAVMTGYQAAFEDGMQVIVKIDGDGQMDPALIPSFVGPILHGDADYTKGNRFFDLHKIQTMPPMRLFGNAVLSLITKLSSGYWNLFDPTNGYTAIHADIARRLPLERISPRYFFETDILFRLNTLRAVVVDVPMDAHYGDEKSNLQVSNIVGEFLLKHVKNLIKRVFYNYYLRDMSLASIELLLGIALLTFGLIFGGVHWWESAQRQQTVSAGTVMLAALPIILGVQFVLAFVGYDIASVPIRPVHRSGSRYTLPSPEGEE
jgi:glycosyltransferase involved in cell wall biosynthesis